MYKLTNLHTVVQVYSVTTVYILEKFGASFTGQRKLIECSVVSSQQKHYRSKLNEH